ncbi:MAG: [LysW]-aminoadipate kinase [Thermoplasmata archaeon]
MAVVVKVGGAPGNEIGGLLDELAQDPSRYVLVHGGSDEVDRLAAALGTPSRYYTAPSGVVSRYTDEARMEVVIRALAGTVQTRLVRELAARGTRAVGLSGVDGGLVLARRKTGARAVENGRVVRLADDRSGSIESVRPDLVERLRGGGYLPVVGPPAITAEGEIVNVDADRVAAAVAAALRAEALVLLTNVGGLRRDPEDPASLVARIDGTNREEALGWAQGRMHKKLRAALEARAAGVPTVVVAASKGERPVARALGGEGTVIA